MVSAAKLRRAQEAMFAARPYARKMMEVLNSLASRAHPEPHPLLAGAGRRAGSSLVVVTADKGLCGGFNANIIRAAVQLPGGARRAGALSLDAGGPQGPRLLPAPALQDPRRARGRLPGAAVRDRPGDRQRARSRSSRQGEVDEVYLVYNEFKSVIQQRIVVERLLPIEQADRRSQGARPRLPLRAGPARDLRGASSPSTWRSRSGGRSWSRRPPSTARAWRPWTPPPTTPADMIERPDPLHEQGPPGRHHQGDHRGGLGRGLPRLSRTRRSMATGERRSGRPDHRARGGRRVRRERARHLQRPAHPGRGARAGRSIDVIAEVEQHLGREPRPLREHARPPTAWCAA